MEGLRTKKDNTKLIEILKKDPFFINLQGKFGESIDEIDDGWNLLSLKTSCMGSFVEDLNVSSVSTQHQKRKFCDIDSKDSV